MSKLAIIDDIKEKLYYTINFQYRLLKEDTVLTVLTDDELEQIEQLKDHATKEELFDLIKIYHLELKRLRKDIMEIIEHD